MTFRSIDPTQFRTQAPNTPYEKELFHVLFSKKGDSIFSKENRAPYTYNEEKQTATSMRIKTMLVLGAPLATIEEAPPHSRPLALTSKAIMFAQDNLVHYKNIDEGLPETIHEADVFESFISLSVMNKSDLLIGDLVGRIKQLDISTQKITCTYPLGISSGVPVVTGYNTNIFGGYSDGSLARYDTRTIRPSMMFEKDTESLQYLYPRRNEQQLFTQDTAGLIKLFDLRKIYDATTVYNPPENRNWSTLTCCGEYQTCFLATVDDNENESTLYRVNKTTGAITPLQKIIPRVSSLYYHFNKRLLISHHNSDEKAIIYWEFDQKKQQFKEKSFATVPGIQSEQLQTYMSNDKTVHGFLSKKDEALDIVRLEHPKVDASEKMYFTIR